MLSPYPLFAQLGDNSAAPASRDGREPGHPKAEFVLTFCYIKRVVTQESGIVTAPTGFGKPVHKQKKAGVGLTERKKAARQYDSMQDRGLPEFNIFIRVKGLDRWFPAGSLVVERSNQIDAAIFQQEEQLVKGGGRLFPVLLKHRDSLEYGYRLKQFNDEPIRVAVPPKPGIPNPVSAITNKVSGLFSRQSSDG